MTKKEAERRALRLVDKWKEIVTDAFLYEYLVDDICLGCGKRSCDGCPAGTRQDGTLTLEKINMSGLIYNKTKNILEKLKWQFLL